MKKQKSGLYRAKIKIGVGPDGKDLYKYLSGRTMRELEVKKQKAYEYYILGRGPRGDRLFGDYALEWFYTRKAPNVSKSSQVSYRTALNQDILPVFAKRHLRAIAPMDLQAFVNRFAGMSQTKITMIIATLNGIFEAACADQYLDRNPAAHLTRPAAKPPAVKPALEPAQRQALEAVCAGHPWGHYLAIMYYLGVRPGEARGLQWGDIDWTLNRVHICRDVDYKARGQVGALKTPASDRVIPLPSVLRSILEPLKGDPQTHVAHGERSGAPLAKTSAERIWVELMVEAGMAESLPAGSTRFRPGDIRAQYRPIITPHALRHNYITMCWEHGIDPYTTMKLAGHTSIKTTMDIYTHLSNSQLEKTAIQVEALFPQKVALKLQPLDPPSSTKN